MPGHTLGSAVFQISSSAAPAAPHAAFTGDTLFCGGCGRLFEGSSLQLHASLRRLRTRLAPNCQAALLLDLSLDLFLALFLALFRALS